MLFQRTGNMAAAQKSNLKRVSVFGNPLVSQDSLPLKILPRLQKRFPEIEFIVEDPTEILNSDQDVWWIMDSAEGISQVMLIEDISLLKTNKKVSVHDYDLGLDLKLLLKLGKVKKIKIIALPVKIRVGKAYREVEKIITAN